MEKVCSLPMGEVCSTSPNQSVTMPVHLLGGDLGGAAVRLGGRAALGAFEHAQDELAEQRLVADAQRVKIIFHLHIRRVPLLQRTPGDLAGNVRQNFQGGLH